MQTDPARSIVSVLLVEDHPMFRERLSSVISRRGDMSVCGETDNVKDAIALCNKLRPDIAVVDLTLRNSNGLDFLKDLKTSGVNLPVLILSMHDEQNYAERALRAGARGYITKTRAASEVMDAIEQVLRGNIYLSREMTARMLGRLGTKASVPGDTSALTDRELDVFQRIGRGESVREIATSLSLGLSTIETYRARIKEKLGLKNGTELQRRAIEWVNQNPT